MQAATLTEALALAEAAAGVRERQSDYVKSLLARRY